VESIQVETADGVRLAGVHVTPDGGDRPGLAFVLAHGFTVSSRKPTVRRIARRLARHGGVLAVDFRGHGRSGGRSSVGDAEVLDVDAAVRLARTLGYERVGTLGFSMGGAIVLRHAARAPTVSGLTPAEPVDAVVSVSAPSRWYIRDTPPMRRVHWLLESRTGRLVSATVLRTRLGREWVEAPESPVEVVGRIPPTPLLVVHGGQDLFFGVAHGRDLAGAAGDAAELWEIAGFGHAEGATTPALVDRIAGWVADRVAGTARPAGTIGP
jgi:pimeloyl-ACP methyl ester carboxylesterase